MIKVTDKFYYRREHEHEMGWSLCIDGKPIAYGDKNICCGLALIMNRDKYDDGKKLIEDAAGYFYK